MPYMPYEVIDRGIDCQFGWMVFGDNFQGSGEVLRIKHGLKYFMVYYLSFVMQI